MTQADPEVLALSERAKAAGLNIAAILREARVAPSTWTRWCNGSVEPKVSTLRSVREAVDRHIGAGSQDAAA